MGVGKAKLECSFCYCTNTKWVEKTESYGFLNMNTRSLGKVEEIDSSAGDFYRCINCGEIICKPCLSKMKSKKGVMFKHYVCPKCDAKMVIIS